MNINDTLKNVDLIFDRMFGKDATPVEPVELDDLAADEMRETAARNKARRERFQQDMTVDYATGIRRDGPI